MFIHTLTDGIATALSNTLVNYSQAAGYWTSYKTGVLLFMNIFVFDHKLKTNAQHESEIANTKILKGNSCQTVTFSNSEFG